MSKKLFSAMSAVVLVLSLSVLAAAKDGSKSQDMKSVTLTGNILDVACSAGNNTPEKADNHKKGCSLSERCLKSGLGVYADGKFVAFDEAGTTKAKAALEKTAKANGAKFKVMGKMAGDKLSVESISEVE
jgi:hypothetical protein